jgi:hypothetical protein
MPVNKKKTCPYSTMYFAWESEWNAQWNGDVFCSSNPSCMHVDVFSIYLYINLTNVV